MSNEILNSEPREKPKASALRDSGGLWYALKDRPPQVGRALPTPTRDEEALKADLDTHGYCLVAEALDNETTDRIRQRIAEQAAAEVREGVARFQPEGFQAVANLLNKGEIFQRLLTNELVNGLVAHLIGRRWILSALSANRTIPGSSPQGLHIDQTFAGVPLPIPIVANVGWMIDEFTEDNGGTRIIPGSHLFPPDQVAASFQGINRNAAGVNAPGTIAATGRAGTALIFDGRLLHGTGQNVTKDVYRTAIFQYCCRGWVRSVVNPFVSISDDVMATFPPEVKARLGYIVDGYAGGYQNPGDSPPMELVRPTNQIREMV